MGEAAENSYEQACAAGRLAQRAAGMLVCFGVRTAGARMCGEYAEGAKITRLER